MDCSKPATINLDFEHGSISVLATRVGRAIEQSTRAKCQAAVRLLSARPGEFVQHLECVTATGANLENRPEVIGAARACRAIERAISSLHQARSRSRAIARIEVQIA